MLVGLIALYKNVYTRPVTESTGRPRDPPCLARAYGYNRYRSATMRRTIAVPTHDAGGA